VNDLLQRHVRAGAVDLNRPDRQPEGAIHQPIPGRQAQDPGTVGILDHALPEGDDLVAGLGTLLGEAISRDALADAPILVPRGRPTPLLGWIGRSAGLLMDWINNSIRLAQAMGWTVQ